MPLVEARVEYEHQLYALQLVTGVLAYAYINKSSCGTSSMLVDLSRVLGTGRSSFGLY